MKTTMSSQTMHRYSRRFLTRPKSSPTGPTVSLSWHLYESNLTIITEDDGQSNTLTLEDITALRKRLIKVGPEQFYEETIESDQFTPVLLGTAFGINPIVLETLGEDRFGRVLVGAIIRAYKKRQKLPQYNTVDDVAQLLRERSNVMVITGAGISTSLGIPDFRSKGTGFYSKLLEMGFSEPEEVFDIDLFDENPRTFYELAGDILPDLQRYSPTHAFIRLLQDKGKLQTNYTQNIDNLEELAGIKKEKLIQAHGSFASATCRKCGYKVKGTEIFDDIRNQRVAMCKRCIATLPNAPTKKPRPTKRHSTFDEDDDEDDDIPAPGVMKPDITFFGERLPEDFFDRFTKHDAPTVNLVLVIGTSLKVAPVSEMIHHLPESVPAVYVGREVCAHVDFDVQLLGECDEVVKELCRRVGWAGLGQSNGAACQNLKGGRGQLVVEQMAGSEHHWIVRREKDEERAWSNGKKGEGEKVAGEGFAKLDVTRSI